MSVIELKNLTKEYAPNVGCFDVSLSIDASEVYGFIGPNGAGKTTVIRQLVGFIKPKTGSATILGHDTWKNSAEIMKSLGYLAGEVVLPDYMTGKRYLKTLANIRNNVDWNYVEKLIKYFEFNVDQKIKKMSKGMKQKVAIVSAFMHKPKILILDEPTSGLDPLMQEKFNTLIRDFKKDGATIFMSSHIFGEIDNTCDKVAVIKKGRIISEVSIKDIKDTGEKNYEIQFAILENYHTFLQNKWTVVDKNDITKTVTISILNQDVNEFLKNISNYKIDKFKELPFNLEAHFFKFYGDEVKFND